MRTTEFTFEENECASDDLVVLEDVTNIPETVIELYPDHNIMTPDDFLKWGSPPENSLGQRSRCFSWKGKERKRPVCDVPILETHVSQYNTRSLEYEPEFTIHEIYRVNYTCQVHCHEDVR
jgi:hypothetical protein